MLLDGPGGTASECLYQHTLPNGSSSQGLLHFYKKADKWHYVPAEEYEAKKAELPPVCFAIKSPVKDLENKPWPDLAETEKQL